MTLLNVNSGVSVSVYFYLVTIYGKNSGFFFFLLYCKQLLLISKYIAYSHTFQIIITLKISNNFQNWLMPTNKKKKKDTKQKEDLYFPQIWNTQFLNLLVDLKGTCFTFLSTCFNFFFYAEQFDIPRCFALPITLCL